ncbi:MAG: site-specific integrase [Prevotella sp.]|nr:site-specific integrase [Prevotella sp.]
MGDIKIEMNFYITVGEPAKPAESEAPSIDFFEEAEYEVEHTDGNRSLSTIGNYLTALNSLRHYLGRSIDVSELTADIIGGYQKWLREQNIKPNTISCYTRSLRSVYHRIAHRYRLPADSDPFKGAFTGNSKTAKRSLAREDLQRIRQLCLPEGSFLSLSRDIFLFSFYAQGMPFVDIAFLTKAQISDGVLVYYRHKTGTRVAIGLEPPMVDIIRRYEQRGRERVFPILKARDEPRVYKEYLQKLGRYNRALHKISAMARLSKPLTSYVARHSWASMAYGLNVDLPVISQALGHTNPHTTLLYIKELDDERLQQANRRILKDLQ